MNNVCHYLDWDSNFFGVRIARVSSDHLSEEIVGDIAQWCAAHTIDCLYLLADAGDQTTVQLAEDNHFRLVDLRVTLEKQFPPDVATTDWPVQPKVRRFAPKDIPTLRLIAKTSHRDTRFYTDTNFPAELSDNLYETWIEKSCNGYADTVLVAEIQGKPAGYVTCHRSQQGDGQIGLIAVDEQCRGLKLGQELVTEALRWFAAQGASRVRVVTQGKNCPAQRLYQRSGFLTHSVQLWYHRWFTKSTE